MATQYQQQPASRIGELYCQVLRAIMREHNIECPPTRPGHVIPAHASFQQVVQYTYDWYCVQRGTDSYQYRDRRYRQALASTEALGGRTAHIDIGCGAGLFSWVLLDWANDNGLPYGQIDLYGLDHSQEMINLAYAMRHGLAAHIADYPQLHYTHEVDVLLQDLTNGHHAGTDYIVTFGHVLVQIQRPGHIRDSEDVIQDFTQVISHILHLTNGTGRCDLLAVDAHGDAETLETSWNALLSNLEQSGVSHQSLDAPRSARGARVFTSGNQGG